LSYLKKEIAYKVVTRRFKSSVHPHLRDNISPEHVEGNQTSTKYLIGTQLIYKPGTTVTSPNGFHACKNGCCRGIHAYTAITHAIKDRVGTNIIIKVKGKWWKAEPGCHKVRSEKVEVLEIVCHRDYE